MVTSVKIHNLEVWHMILAHETLRAIFIWVTKVRESALVGRVERVTVREGTKEATSGPEMNIPTVGWPW